MFYRVRKFTPANLTMEVLDKDENQSKLMNRTNIDTSKIIGAKTFSHPSLIAEGEKITLTGPLGAQVISTDIIKE